MSRTVAYPFLTLSEESVGATPWLIAMGAGELAPAGEFLADWDYSAPVRVQRTIALDPGHAAADLAIPATDLSLAVGLRVGTGRGRLPRAILLREYRECREEEPTVTLDAILPGSALSEVLDLTVEILLDRPAASASDLSPDQTRDRVWQDTKRVRLEGQEPRFPIEVADFHELLGGAMGSSAPWYLRWSPHDWSRDFHGALRLYLNSAHPKVLERVEGEDAETLRVLLAEVMSQVCERFVAEEDVEGLLESCEPGSLGSQARHWLELAWPGRELAFSRSLLANRPGVFRAAFLELAEQREQQI